jgi:LSD1 subclass zinc finger protein
MPEIRCSKCGAPIKFEAGDRFVRCGYCDTQMFIDRSGAGFFYIMPYFVDRPNAEGIFRRWTAGARMARDLEAAARIVDFKQAYFPVYMFRRDLGGKEQVHVEPAKSTTLPGLHSLKVPAGDLKIFDQGYRVDKGVEMIQPDIDMAAYFPGLQGKPLEQALVYFPIWAIQYEYGGGKYATVIDGSSGEVYAGGFPTRKSAPYFLIAGAAFGIFLVEGLVGFVLALISPLAWLLTAGVALATVPFVTAAAYAIVRRY